MIVSIRELSEIFGVSHSKIYSIIGRPEFSRFFREKIKKTRYFDLTEESENLFKKWAKRRTRKNGTYEIKDKTIMQRVRINSLCKKYGYSYSTINVILSRAEFNKYRDAQGRLIIWNDEAEQRFLKIMGLKEGRTIYGFTGRESI